MPIITVGGNASIGSEATFGDLIEKVYRRAMGGQRERTVTSPNSLLSTDTTVTFSGDQTAGMAPGVIIAIELELLYILDWNGATFQATVERGYYNSTPTDHAAGILCYMNPRYSRYDIATAINDDLRSLSSPENGLFRVGTATITYNPVYQGYDLGDLPDNFIDILEVRYTLPQPYRNFPPISKWKVLRNVPNSAFPSGHGLVFYQGAYPGLPIYIAYSAPFVRFVGVGDSVINTPSTNDEAPPLNGYTTNTVPNLTPTMIDLPPIGAEIDLTVTREIKRNFTESQPDPRKASEVPAGSIQQSVNVLNGRRLKRISEEADRLTRQYTRIKGW